MEELSLEIEQQILGVLQLQKSSVNRLRNSSVSERIEKLKALRDYVISHEDEICRAMYDDFKKPASEVLIAEIFGIKHEINHAISSLRSWMAPQRTSTPIFLLGTSSYIQKESKGLTLIISPWNYPLNLSICPLVLAIAAGNTAILKPSELTPNVSAFIKKMISSLFDKSEVFVLEGEANVATFLLRQKFDHIFFTGSPMIGKKVMEAASRHLTSVTLELGGKSPAIVDETCDLQVAARKIVWGKFFNNGQTCIAPDYVIVHETVYLAFLEALQKAIELSFGELSSIQASKDYCRIVNRKHFHRIIQLLEDALGKGAKVYFGGETNEVDHYISPTLITGLSNEMQIMQEEIFGPILPVLSYQSQEELVDGILAKEKPLSLYIFSKNKEFEQYVLAQTSSGTAVVNDCLIQFGHPSLPFGGVNHSGIGKTTGLYGFLEFSNQKSVLIQKTNFLKLIYPPYNLRVKWLIDKMVKWF
jgi:aldehyde dehydrogenase (NAD+)